MQTAVEWLVEQMIKCGLLPKSIHPDSVLFHKAKEMEKGQLKEAQVKYVGDSLGFRTILENQFEDWYNEKYKK